VERPGKNALARSVRGSTNSPGANLVARSAPAGAKPGMVSDNPSLSAKPKDRRPAVFCRKSPLILSIRSTALDPRAGDK